MSKKLNDAQTIYQALKEDKTSVSLDKLLKSGLNPDSIVNDKTFKDQHGKTLLQIVCQDKDIAKLKTLFKYGCHVNYSTKDVLDDQKLVTVLDKNVKDLTKTSLFYGICCAYKELVGVLVEAGADASIRCKDRMTALMHAVDSQNIDIVKLVAGARNCDVNAQDIYGLSALHMAAIHGRTDIIEFLIQHRARVDIKQYQGGTPLFLATTRPTLSVLLAYGSDPNQKTKEDVSVMNCLMKKTEDKQCILDLLESGFQISKSHIDDIAQNPPKIIRNNADVLDTMHFVANRPVSLKLQATHIIRKTVLAKSKGVGYDFDHNINRLPLPNLLKQFVRSLGLKY